METVTREEDPISMADGKNLNIYPSPLQFHSDKTGKLIPLGEDKLLNRHCLLPFEEDGSPHHEF